MEVKKWLNRLFWRHPSYFLLSRVAGNPPSFLRPKFVMCDMAIHKRPDVAISYYELQDDPNWVNSLQMMYDNLRPGGLLIVTCAERGRNITIGEFWSVLPPYCWQVDSYDLRYSSPLSGMLFWGIKSKTHEKSVTKIWADQPGHIVRPASFGMGV